MKLVIFSLLASLMSFAYGHDKTVIAAYTYHKKPPLIINQETKTGLYYDFINYLNEHSNKYQFELIYVPRKRIERMLNTEEVNGFIVGVNPVWFNDKQETKYFWTSRIFTDSDEVVSLNKNAIEFLDAQSLSGKTFGGVRGFYYQGINQAVAEGNIKRIDTANEITLFNMLLHQRVDIAIISRSTFDYMVKINNWQSIFHLSKKPHDVYDRRVLVPLNQSTLYHHIAAIVEDMQFDQFWTTTTQQYR